MSTLALLGVAGTGVGGPILVLLALLAFVPASDAAVALVNQEQRLSVAKTDLEAAKLEAKAVRERGKAQADVIVLLGDYVSGTRLVTDWVHSSEWAPALAGFMKKLEAKVPA